MIHRHKEPYGRAATIELEKFLAQSTVAVIEHQRFVEENTAALRAVNAERRLQDQRDLDADYRNYIVPV